MISLSVNTGEWIDLVDSVNDRIQKIEDKIEIAGTRGNEHLRHQCDELRKLVVKLESSVKY